MRIGFPEGMAIGAFLGILVTIFSIAATDFARMNECRERYQVYACELRPVPNPIWVKPNAENT